MWSGSTVETLRTALPDEWGTFRGRSSDICGCATGLRPILLSVMGIAACRMGI